MRAIEAVTKHPMLSNLAIAEKIGVDEKTVRRARKEAGSAFAERDRKPTRARCAPPLTLTRL
jgi:hypothetical protein